MTDVPALSQPPSSASQAPEGVDRSALEERVAQVSRALGYHGGGVRLESLSPGGLVRLRYVGMCTGCPTRVLCGAYTVTPEVLRIQGVRSVELPGTRISDEARARLEAALGGEHQQTGGPA